MRNKVRPNASATTLAYGSNSKSSTEDQFAIGSKMSGDGRETSKVFRTIAFSSFGKGIVELLNTYYSSFTFYFPYVSPLSISNRTWQVKIAIF